MQNKIVTVFGGTGFIGRHVVSELAKKGCMVKVATRVPESAYFLKPYGNIGQIVAIRCDYNDYDSIKNAVRGSDYAVNLIGILFEKRQNTFERVHVQLAENIAKACTAEGIRALTHLSALGVEKATSKYGKSKKAGEEAVKQAFPKASILRPSVVFGEDDHFFNKFAEMARYMPFLPLIGGGHTKFQPAYVGDVAQAVVKTILEPGLRGHCYELGGNEILTFKEIYEKLFRYTGRRRALLSVPFGWAKMKATVLEMLPNPPLTRDQVESLKQDNVVSANALGYEALGIVPKGLDIILPLYLNQYRAGGRFGEQASA